MPSYSNDPVVSASLSTKAPAVTGEGHDFEGVRGISHNEHGAVVGINDYAPASPPGAGGNGAWFESAQGEGVRGQSKTQHHGGVVGVNTAGGFGVYGLSDGAGVVGESKTWMGVYGKSESTTGGAGVMGEGIHGEGVRGVSHNGHGAVVGINDCASDLDGANKDWCHAGWFESYHGEGVRGTSHNGHGAVVGINDCPSGIGCHAGYFLSYNGEGVRGTSHNSSHGAVVGVNTAGGIGVYGEGGTGSFFKSDSGEAVHAETKSNIAAIAAYNQNANGDGFAVFAKKEGTQGFAGFFDGNVWVSRKLTVGEDIVLANADCAEDFTVGAQVLAEPGSVMVLGEEGALFPCLQAYDKRVAGVVSGAGDYKPGIVLDKQDSLENRSPIALIGKVYCKVDAAYGAVEIGDLLTTSPTLGHAMKAADPLKAFGAIIGKALRPLQAGQGLIPILVALQ